LVKKIFSQVKQNHNKCFVIFKIQHSNFGKLPDELPKTFIILPDFFCKYVQITSQEEFLIFDFIIQLTKWKTSKSYFGIKWKLPSAFFSHSSFPFFLFAWIDSGRQNSICRGQQPNLCIPSSTIKAQIDLASFFIFGQIGNTDIFCNFAKVSYFSGCIFIFLWTRKIQN
jgi:hypothetical protein